MTGEVWRERRRSASQVAAEVHQDVGGPKAAGARVHGTRGLVAGRREHWPTLDQAGVHLGTGEEGPSESARRLTVTKVMCLLLLLLGWMILRGIYLHDQARCHERAAAVGTTDVQWSPTSGCVLGSVDERPDHAQ